MYSTGLINNPQAFPIYSLGQNLSSVVIEIHKESGAPIPSIASALLTVVSMACQGRVKIKKRPHLISPVSLWFMVVLGSGERKSAVVKRLLEGVAKFMKKQEELEGINNENYLAELQAWESEKKGIISEIKKFARKGSSSEESKEYLVELAKKKPVRKKCFKLVHENATPEAIVANLDSYFPTTALISDESATIFSGRALSDLGALNKIFDGGSITVDRASRESFTVHDAKITVSLFSQREVLQAYLRGKGELARSVGFLARFFVASPSDTAGTRFIANSSPADQRVIDKFNGRIIEILDSHISEDNGSFLEALELQFEPNAQHRWEQEHDYIERLLAPGGILYPVKDFGAKLPDKMARLAAILHYFDGGDGAISAETLDRAIHIARWFADEFIRCFLPPPPIPQEITDANNLLLPWLANHIRTSGLFGVKKTILRRDGPNQLRNKSRLNAALIYLANNNILQEQEFENSMWVRLNQAYFTPYQVRALCVQSSNFRP